MASPNQELLASFDQLAQGVQQVQISNAIKRAQAQVDAIRNNNDMNDFEKIRAQQNFAQNVAASVLAVGGDAAQAQQARLSLAPVVPDEAMRTLEATGKGNLADAQEALRQKQIKQQQDQETFQNKLAMQKQSAHDEAMKEIAGMKLGATDQKLVTDTAKAYDPTAQRSGQFGRLAQLRSKALSLNTLFSQYKQPDGTYNVPEAQKAELTAGIAAMVNGGSAPAQQQIQHMMFQSGVGDINHFVSYLMNEPRGTGQQAAFAQLHDTVTREQQTAEQQLGEIIDYRHSTAMTNTRNPQLTGPKLQSAHDKALMTFAPSYKSPLTQGAQQQTPSAQNSQGYPVGGGAAPAPMGTSQGGPNPMQYIKLNP
jgi:hypothetical protein